MLNSKLPADSQPLFIDHSKTLKPSQVVAPATNGPAQPVPLPLRKEFQHITQRMYTQNLALAQTNRTLSILRAIDLLVLESNRDLVQLSVDITKAITDSSPYTFVGIMSLARNDDKFINLHGLSCSNLLEQKPTASDLYTQIQGLCLSLDSSWLSSSEHNLIISLDAPEAQQNLVTIGFGEAISKAIIQLYRISNIRSLYLTKLGARSKLTGAMMVGLEETTPKIDDIELIERLSEPVGIALDSRLLYEENQRFMGQLQKNNEHLRQLDQAKDEFISLVSHQLRTPLTSVKGILSLVLEGDVGPISDQQRGMLQQAFDSSQRMVYVIADLLNASRLQSGKFVIINRVTYLNEVVESEVEQLRSSAKSHNIELNFVKPTEFPPLLLDETKIRQVIMNFLDNALYYTPAGGQVDVSLEVAPSSIEFKVTDSGLGVPKDEQANLFTKFYRAANARQMRPEGTGLGLYMAKKVVVAQGGSIIFTSEEGKGSTFGFMFPLDKVTVTPTTDQVVLAKNAVDSSLV